MKCDLCGHDEAIAGQQLCPVCVEAIRRVAYAVNDIGSGANELQHAVPEVQHSPGAVPDGKEFLSAFATGRG